MREAARNCPVPNPEVKTRNSLRKMLNGGIPAIAMPPTSRKAPVTGMVLMTCF